MLIPKGTIVKVELLPDQKEYEDLAVKSLSLGDISQQPLICGRISEFTTSSLLLEVEQSIISIGYSNFRKITEITEHQLQDYNRLIKYMQEQKKAHSEAESTNRWLRMQTTANYNHLIQQVIAFYTKIKNDPQLKKQGITFTWIPTCPDCGRVLKYKKEEEKNYHSEYSFFCPSKRDRCEIDRYKYPYEEELNQLFLANYQRKITSLKDVYTIIKHLRKE